MKKKKKMLTRARVAMNYQAHVSQLTKYNVKKDFPNRPNTSTIYICYYVAKSSVTIPKPSHAATSKKIEKKGSHF